MSTESTKAALFETRYRNALTAYVQQEMEDALMDAFELGRKALAEGHGLLDLVAIHHTLLASLIEQSSNGADIQRRVARAREFLTQAAAPFEMAHRGWHEMASERAQAARELERLNRELQKRAAELEASNKELESFAYSVSHDLRAPLRHVAAYSELLQKQASSSLDDKSRRYVQTILESAKRMGNLIDDLLAFSRLGRAEAKMRAVDLQQVVKEAIAEVSRDTRDRDIAWKIGALPACHGDSSMLKLVVVNLVSNAVKFTRMRTRAEIEIGCVDKDNDELEVFVRDNGAGFDMQYANKLFGVFQRLHLAEQFEGTGIGLATVQRITHRHGGQVRAEGAVDQGATFYFSLPKAHDLAERTAGTS